MADLKTTYLGIELKNPLIIGSNSLITDVKNAKAIEEAGASAIVYKSLFEEQIQLESYELDQQMEAYNERNAEMTKLFPDLDHAGPREFLMNLKKVKQAVSIPVFASLNCVNRETWVAWARELESTGIDGLELNFYHVPVDFNIEEAVIIQEQVDITKDVVKALKIPVAVKLSPFYTNPLNFVKRLDKVGAKAFVMFNSLFQPDIDVKTQKLVYKYKLSNEEDNRLPLRYAGLLAGNVKASICSSSGLYHGNDIVKMILAGADSVQVVSAIYKFGFKAISKMLEELETWMKENNYKSLSEFRGKMSKNKIKSPFAYKRAQYVDILLRSSEVMQEYALR
ncbi:MAG: dihydroorotate dehydrogenase-like protein [Salinivirgaceae bacterium]|nr:dihydroorotate dehydrogenase-like protein [Salinivirgaceae bacterium]